MQQGIGCVHSSIDDVSTQSSLGFLSVQDAFSDSSCPVPSFLFCLDAASWLPRPILQMCSQHGRAQRPCLLGLLSFLLGMSLDISELQPHAHRPYMIICLKCQENGKFSMRWKGPGMLQPLVALQAVIVAQSSSCERITCTASGLTAWQQQVCMICCHYDRYGLHHQHQIMCVISGERTGAHCS